jgi:hypothetical protein
MNTLASFVERQPGVGYVRHYFIDFGDSLGSIWEPPMLGRRLGHANYLDFGDLVEDFVSLGAIRRPWDRARFGPTGTVFGYYDVELFDPDKWQPGYPNPAFSRMQEADAAWAARILARFGDAQLDAMIDEAQLYDGRHVDRLRQVLRGRRAKLLERYLNALSPLSEPRLNTNAERHRLCLQDLRVNTSYVGPPPGAYAARHWHSPDFRDSSALTVSAQEAEVCADFPEGLRHHAEPQYHIVDVWDAGRKPALPPTRVHFYVTTNGAHVVGLERPCNHASPAE